MGLQRAEISAHQFRPTCPRRDSGLVALRAPLRAGATHVVQLGPVGIEQALHQPLAQLNDGRTEAWSRPAHTGRSGRNRLPCDGGLGMRQTRLTPHSRYRTFICVHRTFDHNHLKLVARQQESKETGGLVPTFRRLPSLQQHRAVVGSYCPR
jgi:hypothetical protein